MKPDFSQGSIKLDVSEYDYQMLMLALIHAWRADDESSQLREWAKQTLIKLDPATWTIERTRAFEHESRT